MTRLHDAHKDTINELLTKVGVDYSKMTPVEATMTALKYPDDLWARYFEQVYDMKQFSDKQFLQRMMLFYRDYFNESLSRNET